MATLELKKGFYSCGVLDKKLRVFDIVMATEHGSSYNAYLLKSEGEIAIFDTVKDSFFEEYYANLTSLVDIKDIKYLIVNHTEPDHAGNISKLLDINPNIEIIATVGAINFLGEILNKPFKSIKATNALEIKVGAKRLKFFLLPNLHWPDTMFTYIVEDKTLLTCDSFGAHYALDNILASNITDVEGYLAAEKYYFDGIIAPFKNPYMLKGIDVVSSLDVDMICAGHGAVHDSGIPELLTRYKKWCQTTDTFANPTVVIPYVSAYGYTKKLAISIAEGIEMEGVDVIMFDMVTSDSGEVLDAITKAKGVLFGTPTILGDALKPIMELAISLNKFVNGKKVAGAFGSYGWSGEGVPNITARLMELGFDVEEGLRVRFNPTEVDLLRAKAYGANFAAKVKLAK